MVPFGDQTDWPDRLDRVTVPSWQTLCERFEALADARRPPCSPHWSAPSTDRTASVLRSRRVVSQVLVDLGEGWPWDAPAGSLRWQEARGEHYAGRHQHADRRGPTGADGRMPLRAVG